MQHVVDHYGLAFLFAIVAAESAGAWVPGETALIAAGVLASRGNFAIWQVILVAAAGAILGDNVGYWIGRTLGRRYLHKLPFAERLLPPAERFFERHGGKAVFLARFVAVVRVTGAWMAGISGMRWWRFLAWNALGGVAWAVAVGLVAFYFGHAAADLIARYGLLGAAAAAVLALLALAGVHVWRRRMASL